MAFRTLLSQLDGTENRALMLWRGQGVVRIGLETKRSGDLKRTETPIGLATVSTALKRSIGAVTGTTRFANRKFAH